MTRFIRLTNNWDKHKGNPVYININHISSFFNDIREDTGMERTVVYSIKSDTMWEVEESASEIYRKILEVTEK